MAPEAAKYLWDAVQAAYRVERFAADLSFESYEADEVRRSAIERQLEILGEALNQLRKIAPEVAALITDLPRAVALRNVLIHGYATVDNAIVWGVVAERLLPLLKQLETLLPPTQTSS